MTEHKCRVFVGGTPDDRFCAGCGKLAHQHHGISRTEQLEEALRSLAAYVSAGGYNAPEVDPDVFYDKVVWGIDHLTQPLNKLIEDLRADRVKLQGENEMLRQELREFRNATAVHKASAYN
jgi:hypothetical protein